MLGWPVKAPSEFSVRCYVKPRTHFLANAIHTRLYVHVFFNSFTFLGKKVEAVNNKQLYYHN